MGGFLLNFVYVFVSTQLHLYSLFPIVVKRSYDARRCREDSLFFSLIFLLLWFLGSICCLCSDEDVLVTQVALRLFELKPTGERTAQKSIEWKLQGNQSFIRNVGLCVSLCPDLSYIFTFKAYMQNANRENSIIFRYDT